MSTLEVGLDNLSTVDYRNIFEAIMHNLKKTERLFSIRDESVTFDIDKLADAVAQQLASSNRYPFENRDGTTQAAIHMPTTAQKEEFSEQFERLILQELRTSFERALHTLPGKNPESRSIQTYVTRLPKSIATFSTPRLSDKTKTGLKYELDKENPFEKQRLHIQPKQSGNEPRLKGHKLTIQVQDIQNFDRQLINGICNYLKTQGADEEEIEEAKETLQLMANKEDSSFSMLRKIFIRESLARVQRSARVSYLVYLYKAMSARRISDPKKQTGLNLLRIFIERLRLVNEYIEREIDGYYGVTYQGTHLNLRDLFSRSDILNILPIITEVEGSLGESTDYVQGAKTFVNGLKLKLNGDVQIHGGGGKPAFDYYAALLDPGSKAYQQREAEATSQVHFRERVLKVALLYYFVFVNMHDPRYKPAEDFERDILKVFREGSDDDKCKALRQLREKIVSTAPGNLNLLRDALIEFLELPNDSTGHSAQQLVLSLRKDVLVKDIDNMLTHSIFFQDAVVTNDGKDALKYIAVEGANASQDVLCKLPLHLAFDPLYFYETDDPREQFKMSYEIAGVQALPIFLAPYDNDALDRYKNIFQENSRIVLCYRHHPGVASDSERAFVYRFTYQLLAYTFIRLLADNITGVEKRRLFFPVVCLHTQQKAADEPYKKYDEEEFIHALSKTLAHLLAEDYTAGSQGFHLDTLLAQGNDFYKLNSALNSLYAALPRRFQLPLPAQDSFSPSQTVPRRQLDKLAIVVVSSRKSDVNKKTPDSYQATIYGEVIGIERQSDGYVRIGTLSTFSANQPSYLIYEQPATLIAQVKACYAQGYRHFLFVAHAPYSRTLHISDKNSTEDLFFMGRTVIQAMREVGAGIKVYPVFCDKYYVVNPRRKMKKALAADSLYIDDLGELSYVALDPSKRSLIFLNLFSGINVNKQPVYNGVMSYSTLVNVYENDPTYDQYIWSDLLSENIPQSLKGDIVDFITLLHFSRYEKPRDLGFKLDPYTHVIGDTAIGKIAVFPHMRAHVRFNMLAFLTLVRAVMNKEQY
ncbi:MAG TPA: hypothetical protein VNG51_01225 [Ktedonobacteraceae bacterium]|nr:hypothetical protein [Ktedonobacteraceae bacterium]